MKVKKLDTWIHSELANRLGEYWYLWKHTYDVIRLFYKISMKMLNDTTDQFLLMRMGKNV